MGGKWPDGTHDDEDGDVGRGKLGRRIVRMRGKGMDSM